MSSDAQWRLARTAVEKTSTRFADLLETASETHIRAVGQWSIAETAAHVAVVCRADAAIALDDDSALELKDLRERARTASVDDMGELNALGLELEPERNLHLLAEQIRQSVTQLLADTSSADGTERVRWLADVDLPLCGVMTHLASELLIHGYDIARAQRRPWDLPRDFSSLVYEAFFLEFLRNGGARRFLAQGGVRGDVCCEFRVRGCEPVLFIYENGHLAVAEQGAHPVDLHISADPTAMLLVMYNRLNPLRPVLRGQLVAWGRRPWRLGRLMRVMQTP